MWILKFGDPKLLPPWKIQNSKIHVVKLLKIGYPCCWQTQLKIIPWIIPYIFLKCFNHIRAICLDAKLLRKLIAVFCFLLFIFFLVKNGSKYSKQTAAGTKIKRFVFVLSTLNALQDGGVEFTFISIIMSYKLVWINECSTKFAQIKK